MTTYIVLSQDEEQENVWHQVADVDARSAVAAIRSLIDSEGEGVYVATPLRSWSPVTVRVEQVTKVRMS